ncbi:ABC transporter ATP-binding protein [Pseudoalteromonas sp. G4]|uniref:ABC transporter ATP-binding protein n=1 Tax=Pseudoalteromonas sp. G4 TaxID=2992761 RepID=UPI00237D9C9E|nr:ABC transporter ATP-binding protein [Pseudoalteromonas sp. G4]MDE3272688.1 ABC transporter ATP-binding protein [Pseudoalteromonas sp. G4]
MTQPIITIEKAIKSYNSLRVLDKLNWQVNEGDIVGLLGKNAAGKSTLLESIMGLRELEQGEIKLWGYSWHELPQSQKQKIGYVAQTSSAFDWMKVSQYLDYICQFFPSWDKAYCETLLKRWRISDDQVISKLSGGQKQMLDVVQALSIRPELLILDEPVAHLDPNMRRAFLKEVIDLCCEHGTTVIFSTHIVSDLERVANRVAVLQFGVIRHYYELDELKASIAKLSFANSTKTNLLEKDASISKIQQFGETTTTSIIAPLKKPIEEWCAFYGLDATIQPMNLEDWYLEVANEFV